MSRSYPGVCGWTGGCGGWRVWTGVAAAGVESVIPNKRGSTAKGQG